MPKMEQYAYNKDIVKDIYTEREEFIRENYPEEKSHYEMEELLNSGLDGMEVLEKRGKNEDLEALISYNINQDNEGVLYLSIGIMLTQKESQGEGIIGELFSEIKEIARNSGCEYISAIADTEEGRDFFLGNGFHEEEDKINGREYLRLDL